MAELSILAKNAPSSAVKLWTPLRTPRGHLRKCPHPVLDAPGWGLCAEKLISVFSSVLSRQICCILVPISVKEPYSFKTVMFIPIILIPGWEKRHVLWFASLDGALGYLLPCSEKTY